MLTRLSQALLNGISLRKNNRMIFVPIAASGIAALLLAVLATVWAGAESDLAALERQKQLVTKRLDDQVKQVADDMSLLAAGYGSLLSVSGDRDGRSPRFDDARRFGHTVTSVFGFEKLLIVNREGNFPFREDVDTVRRYQWVRPLLGDMLQRVQLNESRKSGGLEPPASSKGVQAELMRLEGRPSLVGIVPISEQLDPHRTQTTSVPLPSYYLIGFRFLDGAALDDFSREMGLNGARYARTLDAEESEVAFQVEATATGDPIGVIIWTPDLPGSRVIDRLTPYVCAAVAVLAILFFFLVFRLNRSWDALRRSEQRSRALALHDVLTKLPNRELFAQRLEVCYQAQNCQNGFTTVALIDLDRFKAVNDSYGHAAGDELLLQATARINTMLSGSDTLARLGGDEFALILTTKADEGADRLSLFEAIVAEFKRPFELHHGEVIVNIGCSIGACALTDMSCSADELLRRADVALYQAKASGRGRFVLYGVELESEQREREQLIEELRSELGRISRLKTARGNSEPLIDNEAAFEIHYQTIHKAGDERDISGAEALVRWRHPRLGLLAPDKFIPLAEDCGLIEALGEFILDQACLVAKRQFGGRTIAVNVSPKQLRHAGFAESVLAIVAQSGLATTSLELELTETALVDDPDQVKDNLSRLRRAGIKIALDDFGTGFSSLSHLIEFGIDRIKIDRSFVRLLDRQSNGAAIAAAITTLGRSLGIETTAEGVETEAQRDFLIAIGCSDLQGYLLSKPVPASELPTFNVDAQVPIRSKAGR
ncbi:diguanylate cyclase (GGDEF) domain-containing protein [Rhizobium sp. NFR07]|uniref:bifunctional diguanylate cyclase/phosphodiesterase n=1 Tax=Rhizobium sp. NFR07 TaxID=1566262 RepID=UPI0008E92E56|nr:EAL domain-containing protein [Rhizobium sp. NFR07]SFB50938.1 diguanylate cyclase (GGDEF) domain-containing protein [Rhizobium sp. NFR07]